MKLIYLSLLLAHLLYSVNSHGEKLSVYIPVVPSSLVPTQVKFMEQYLILQNVSSTLVKINERGRLVGGVTKKWVVNIEEKSIKFYINDDIKFWNGDDITVEDIKYSFQQNIDKKSSIAPYLTRNLKFQKDIIEKSIVKIKKNEFKIFLKKNYPAFLYVLSMPGFSIIQNKTNVGCGQYVPTFLTKKIILKPNKFIKSNLKYSEIVVHEEKNEKITDVYIGLLSERINLQKYKKLSPETLSTVHLYFNMNKTKLQTVKERTWLVSFFQKVKKKIILSNFTSTDHLLPQGILSPSYYENKIDLSKVTPVNEKVEIVFLEGILPQIFFDESIAMAKKMGFSLEFVMKSSKKFMKILESGSYRIIGGRYNGNFPDPDGVLASIDQRSKLKYGVFENNLISSEVEKIKYNPNKRTRINNYKSTLLKWEKKRYFIPLYEFKIPVFLKNEFEMPELSYRYDIELWNIKRKN